jgi:predicted phosphodiesterase
MRYGFISDIHGNFDALEAVLAALDDLGCDEVLCLGDIVGYGAEPSECLAEIRARNIATVAGNHDFAVAGRSPTEYFNPDALDSVLWTRGRLADEELKYLAELPLVLERDGFLCFHGSLRDPEEFNYILSSFEAMACLALLPKPMGFFGHSHVPISFVEGSDNLEAVCESSFPIGDGRRGLVNAGSVGQPRDSVPLAAFCTYDADARRVETHRVPYAVDEAVKKILAAELPERNAYRLLVGR